MIWLIILILICLWMREKISRNWKILLWSLKLPGPTSIPPLGSGHRFMCRKDEIFSRIRQMFDEFPYPLFRIWLGPKFVLMIRDPAYLQTILQSDMVQKDLLMDVGKPFLGEGLITGHGPVWKQHKKIIMPSLGLKAVTGYCEIFDREVKIMCDKMKITLDNKNSCEIILEDFLHPCAIDIVCDTIIGVKLNAQKSLNKDFMDSIYMLYYILYERMAKPWLYPDILFKFSHLARVQKKTLKILRTFIFDVIQKKKDERQSRIVEAVIKSKLASEGIDENISMDVEVKDGENLMLDQLIESADNGVLTITDEEMIDETLTMFLASSDTIASITCFCLKMLAMHPEYQKKVIEEYTNSLPDPDKELNSSDCANLEFLERCIKDTIRLFPIAPLIVRRNNTEFKLSESVTIPPGVTVMMGLFFVHRDPKYWSHPDEFYPDHFLPEEAAKRHNYAYLPFSSGLRSCVGKVYAMVSIKIMVVRVLQKFLLTTTRNQPSVKDMPLTSDISIRAMNGNNVIISAK